MTAIIPGMPGMRAAKALMRRVKMRIKGNLLCLELK